MFLGHQVTKHKEVSDETAHAIDEEIRLFIDRNYDRADRILKENIDKLHMMADALMKYETIDAQQIDDIMNGKEPRPPEGWTDRSPTSSSGMGASKDAKKDTSIGGPASEH